VEACDPAGRASCCGRSTCGHLATPANSSYNELVIEAGRASILNGGREAVIEYDKPVSGYREEHTMRLPKILLVCWPLCA
jgi:hypothetical protein